MKVPVTIVVENEAGELVNEVVEMMTKVERVIEIEDTQPWEDTIRQATANTLTSDYTVRDTYGGSM